jgi:molecular chaperone GrpE
MRDGDEPVGPGPDDEQSSTDREPGGVSDPAPAGAGAGATAGAGVQNTPGAESGRTPEVAGTDPAGRPAPAGAPSADDTAAEVAEAVDLVTALALERDDYRDALIRMQADFENYKKRMIKQQTDHLERAAGSLVEKLLPVLDTADLALAHGGGEDVKQMSAALAGVLEREGLERIDPLGAPFDPTLHDAVALEPGEGPQEVVEVMRAGYRWNGKVLRPAMVKVRG